MKSLGIAVDFKDFFGRAHHGADFPLNPTLNPNSKLTFSSVEHKICFSDNGFSPPYCLWFLQ